MTPRSAATWAVLAAVLAVGCEATTSYRVLSVFFDGVPTPAPAGVEVAVSDRAPGSLKPRYPAFSEHGPYAAKLCTACHASPTSNTFVVPREELCQHCHDLQLDKKYIHGPIASGGCVSCHDPHSSKYRYMLVADAGTFCLHCHQREDIERVPAHVGASDQCTSCHDPHQSDRKYLLR